MRNYFDYDYPQPNIEHPFSIITEILSCPWKSGNRLIHIGLQGKSPDYKNLNPGILFFVVDSSGAMEEANNLPLLKQSLKLLLSELNDNDRVAIVAYADSAGLILPSTPAINKERIIAALDSLHAGGSTAGGEGIVLAYQVAKQNLIKNRITYNDVIKLAKNSKGRDDNGYRTELLSLIESCCLMAKYS